MTEVEHLLEEIGLTVVADTAGGRPIFTITNRAGMAWTYPYPDALDLLTDGDVLSPVEADTILSDVLDALATAA